MSIDTTDAITDEIILDVTDPAVAKVLEIRAEEDDPETLGLRVEVIGTQGVEYTYDLSLDSVAEADGCVAYEVSGLTVLIGEDSVDKLRGAVLDLPSNPMQGGLVIRNPNRPDPLAGVELDLHGTTAEKLQQLLDQQINPALASHGGFAGLVGVEGSTAFVTMGGGCQGCALSAATLREGITVMITEAIEEIDEVVDTTDHGAGENPFYT